MKKNKNNLIENQKTEILYHYCSLETFRKIIQNHTLRFSDITKSNDSDELIYIAKLYQKYRGKKGCDFMQYIIKQNSKNLIHYTFCLSEKGDDLSQWRGYAPNGGVAIGFKRESLESLKEELSFENLDLLKDIVKIKYVDYDGKDRELSRNWKALKSEFGGMPKYEENNFEKIFCNLLKLANEYKNSGFKDEAEWRIYFQNYKNNEFFESVNLPKQAPQLLYNGSAVSRESSDYYDLPFNFSMIKEIIIGPKVFNILGETNGLGKMFFDFIKEKDYNNELEIGENDVKLTKLTYR